jgi:hypothetical protein
MTSPALRKMEFEFIADLGRNVILEIISELGEEFIACDHEAVLLAAAK